MDIIDAKVDSQGTGTVKSDPLSETEKLEQEESLRSEIYQSLSPTIWRRVEKSIEIQIWPWSGTLRCNQE